MGRRSSAETIVDILSAFVERHRWRQAELARHVGITSPALRKHLLELSALAPLTSTAAHPDVFWERPRDWHPAGAIVKGTDVAALVRLLGRTPRCKERSRMMRVLL